MVSVYLGEARVTKTGGGEKRVGFADQSRLAETPVCINGV